MAASQRCFCHALLASRQSESVLAGGNGNGDIQLPPDGSGAHLLSGKQLAAATARFLMAMDSKLCDSCILSSYTRVRPIFIEENC